MDSGACHSDVQLQQQIQVFVIREVEEPQRKDLQVFSKSPVSLTHQAPRAFTQLFKPLQLHYKQTSRTPYS